jgi:predicted RNase H-like HicB family nuclease
MPELTEIELIFAPQEEGGYSVYAPELPGLHTQGEDMDDALANAEEAVALYVEGLREDGEVLDPGIVRRRIKCGCERTAAASRWWCRYTGN